MQPFVLSALLSFAIYQLMAYSEILPRPAWFRIGGVRVDFSPTAATWAQRGLIVIITLLILIGILYVHERVSSFDSISRDKTNIVLGFLFGPLFAIWLNSVFNHPPGTPLTRGLVLGGIGLIVFCMIGSAGNEAGKLLGQIGKRISGIKTPGGFELSLTKSERKSDPSQGALQLAGKPNASFESNSGSVGLGYVSQLDEIVQRDRNYLTQLFGQTDPRLVAQLGHAEELTKFALKPPMKCLAAWLEANADSTYVNERLNLFLNVFRQVSALDSDKRRKEVSRAFVLTLATVAVDVEQYGAPPAVETACLPLLNVFCYSFIKTNPAGVLEISDRPGLLECLNKLPKRESDAPLSGPAAPVAELLAEKLRLFVADNALGARPYFAIAHASFMTQLGQYEAAAAILDGWLNPQKPRSGSEIADKWFAIRARSMLAAYFEEWMLKQGASAPTSYRNEHLNNLGLLRTALADSLGKSKLLKSRSPSDKEIAEFKQPGACDLPGDDEKSNLQRQVFSSYVSIDLTFIQNLLRHPDYKDKFINSANADIVSLVNLDLSCLSVYPPPPLVYAQILDSFAINTLQSIKAVKDAESTESKKTRKDADAGSEAILKNLGLADRAVAYSLEITRDKAQKDLNRSSTNFLERVAASEWASTWESLQQTKAELRNLTSAEKRAVEQRNAED
jgi:hypothetical protein